MNLFLIALALVVGYIVASLVWKGVEFAFKMVFKTALTLILTGLLAWFIYSYFS